MCVCERERERERERKKDLRAIWLGERVLEIRSPVIGDMTPLSLGL